MSHIDEAPGKIVPAQLNFLSIYCPDLVQGDADELDQIVFYHSRPVGDRQKRAPKGKKADGPGNSTNGSNEQLRQVGLAQGMVAFARDFSNGAPVDSVETEKHRIVLKELESGWWILASIDLTRLPNTRTNTGQSSTTSSAAAPPVDYSSREISPPALLIRQLEQAHSIFLLHHGRSLGELYERGGRAEFCDLLDRFWTKFALSWDVLLHGNPSVDLYNGIKLAAGGELGIGVGEEEWGSGERDVLEGLVRNTDGLVDLTVSRFGNTAENAAAQKEKGWNSVTARKDQEAGTTQQRWMGNGDYPGPSDGMIFSGLGTITRPALRTLTNWVAWIYTYGEDAYGVREAPNAGRNRRRRKKKPVAQDRDSLNVGDFKGQAESEPSERPKQAPRHRTQSGIPPPIVSAAEESLKEATRSVDKQDGVGDGKTSDPQTATKGTISDPDQWVKYLTLGYGSVWGGGSYWLGPPKSQLENQAEPERRAQTSTRNSETKPTSVAASSKSSEKKALPRSTRSGSSANAKPTSRTSTSSGYFLVGLKGDLDAEDQPTPPDVDDDTDPVGDEEIVWNNRISIRTLHVETESKTSPRSNDNNREDSLIDQQASIRRLRVLVYIHPPFIYTFLFDPNAISLTLSSSFHDLHHHITPLRGPLLRSTSPATVAARLKSTIPNAPTAIYDLVHSPHSLTTHCSIPNIPIPGTLASEGLPNILPTTSPESTFWSRAEALTVHSQILGTYTDTRRQAAEHERVAKTGKGWWVVWMRVPTTGSTNSDHGRSRMASPPRDAPDDHSPLSEAILVRKATDSHQSGRSWTGGGSSYGGNSNRRATYGGTSAFKRLVGSGSGADASVAAGAGSPGRLAEGIGAGVDPRKYVETLLSLCR